MLHQPKSVAPEPYFSAALGLLYRVALFIRSHADEISAQQLTDLGDAIHNVPASIREYGGNFDEQIIREHYLAHYDKKWVKEASDFSLLRALDNGIEEWRAKGGA